MKKTEIYLIKQGYMDFDEYDEVIGWVETEAVAKEWVRKNHGRLGEDQAFYISKIPQLR